MALEPVGCHPLLNDVTRAELGSGSAEHAEAQFWLAHMLMGKGSIQEALGLFRESMTVRETALGASHADTLSSMSNVANALMRLGRLKEAEEWYRKVRP